MKNEVIEFDGRKWERTGEKRALKFGDVYLMLFDDVRARRANHDYPDVEREILREIPSPSPIIEFEGRRFARTGERHIPRKGEWFVSEKYPDMPRQQVTDDACETREILIPVPSPSVPGEAPDAVKELAQKLFTTAPGQYEPLPTWQEAAAQISEALRPLLERMEIAQKVFESHGFDDSAEALKNARARWEPRREEKKS
jgi:hypothetical protein